MNGRTGVWIADQLDKLTINHSLKRLLAEIISLDAKGGCFASNSYLADLLKLKTNTISKNISELKRLGLIKQTKFDGRKRFLAPLVDFYSSETKEPKKNLAPSSTKSNVRVSEKSQSAFDQIPKPSYSTKYLKNNLQKGFEDFKKWSREKLTTNTNRELDLIIDPKMLPEHLKRMYVSFQRG